MYSFLSIFLLQAEQQGWLFASEKVNTVMAVALVIFLSFIAYVLLTERKVRALEKKMDELEN